MAGKLDIKKAKKAYEESRQGGEFWTPDEGETRIYVLPPCRENDSYEPTDGLNYIPVGVHYSVGANEQMVVCLDPQQNPIIKHPFIQEFLKKRGVVVDAEAGCPVCKAIYQGKMTEAKAAACRFQLRYVWAVMPWDHARQIGKPASKLTPAPVVYTCGRTVYDGIMKTIYEVGDITDFDSAVLVRIEKTGKELKTRYKVQPDIETLRQPVRLDKGTRRIILDAIKEEGDCDLFKVTASMIKGTAQASAVVTGIRTEEEEEVPETSSEESESRKACFGLDCVDDAECRSCEFKVECAEACGVDVPGEGSEAPAESTEEAEPEAEEEAEPEAEAEEEASGEEEGESEEASTEGSGDEELDELENRLEEMGKGKGKGKGKSKGK
jgi:hypothetical protein